ncbi:MAG: tRNA (guanosine(46)-N7)-methyltransferase TrmB [Pirellula sp.]|jgi:tRNA (guanine-N7-)-methyltransferase
MQQDSGSEGDVFPLLDDQNEPYDMPEMRGRYFRDEDEQSFREWIAGAPQIELEIGSGKGLFLLNQCRERPNIRFVGLELAAKYAWDCQSKVQRDNLDNVRFYACNAVAVIDQDVPNASIDAVHVYFPDPWWKAKHKKRRVLNEQSLQNIERILKPNGELHFWTDVLDYYELTLELIDQVTTLDGPFFVDTPEAKHDMDYRTHFERRTRRNGLPVYRSRYCKNQSSE